MADAYDERPLRFCDSCGKVDRAPRHQFATADGDGQSEKEKITTALGEAESQEVRDAILAAVFDNGLVSKHFDCCAADGCPDKGNPDLVSCDEIVTQADGKQDEELVTYLTQED